MKIHEWPEYEVKVEIRKRRGKEAVQMDTIAFDAASFENHADAMRAYLAACDTAKHGKAHSAKK